MVKNNKGVTLMSLAITVLILIMIAGISISLGMEILNQSKDYKTEVEISEIQTAVYQRYILLKSEGNTEIIAKEVNGNISASLDSGRPKTLVGTRIGKLSGLSAYEFHEYKEDYADTSNMAYEEYYYYLNSADLTSIGVEGNSASNDDRAYIVNYSTGEVFDVYNKRYYTSNESVYLEGSASKTQETEYNFTDE